MKSGIDKLLEAIEERTVVGTQVDRDLRVAAVKEYYRCIEHDCGPFLEWDEGVNVSQGDAMEKGMRVYGADDDMSSLGVYRDIVQCAHVIEKEGEVEAVGTLGATRVLMIDGTYDILGNHRQKGRAFMDDKDITKERRRKLREDKKITADHEKKRSAVNNKVIKRGSPGGHRRRQRSR